MEEVTRRLESMKGVFVLVPRFFTVRTIVSRQDTEMVSFRAAHEPFPFDPTCCRQVGFNVVHGLTFSKTRSTVGIFGHGVENVVAESESAESAGLAGSAARRLYIKGTHELYVCTSLKALNRNRITSLNHVWSTGR